PVPPTTLPPSTMPPGPVPAPASYPRAPLAFSLIQNGVPAYTTGQAIGDQIAVALAAYPSGPDPASLGPLPVTPPSGVYP
nr:hypothetical protein [Actinomycetota bacterium]